MTLFPRSAMLFMLGLASLRADNRGSANYTIVTETIDTAGGPATSQDYRNTPSFGDCSGSAATTANATAQPGFVAQLAAVTGVTLAAAAPSLTETATLQLTAWELLADGTRAAIPATGPAWTASGSAAITSAGLVTGAVVYQDSAATAAAAYGGFNATLPLIILNTASDNFGSYANDGLRDDWQVQSFGLANPNAGPALDPDHDGFTNAFECAAALVPTDPASRFNLAIQPVPGQPTRKNIVFSPCAVATTYAVEASTDLIHWAPLTNFSTASAGTQRTVTDLAATGPRKFYRVNVSGSSVSFTIANDALPDDWQAQYFGLANANAAPGLDPDGDGQSNVFEYTAGLIPSDSASRFNLAIQSVPGQPTRKNLVFSPRYDTASYTVESSTDLVHWSPLTAFTTTDAGTQRTVTDLAATGTSKLYRVVIVRP